MNGDGKADIVVGNPNDAIPPNDNPSIGVFLNKGDGTFAAMAAYAYPPHAPIPQTVSLGDLNGDGKPDVLGFGQNVGSDPYFLLNNGDGTLVAPVDLVVNGHVSGGFLTATSDLNGDGKIDVVVTTGAGSIGVLLNSGGAKFAGDVDYDGPGEITGLALADLNGDGKPDLVTSNPQHGNAVVQLNSGNGNFGESASYPVSTGSTASGSRAAAGDFDGDGKADIAIADLSGNISVLKNKGDGTFGGTPTINHVQNDDGDTLVAADLNGDGKPDLALSQGTWGNVVVLMNKGDGTFATPMSMAAGKPALGMAAGDFKGNGVLGLAVVSTDPSSGNGVVTVLLGSCN